MMYDKEYYSNLNYTSYLDRGDKYKKLVLEVNQLLYQLNLFTTPILDYGCAIGHVIKAYKDLGVLDAIGYDISQWAVEHGKNSGLNLTNNFSDLKNKYSIGFFLDVLEHMDVQQIDKVFNNIIFNTFIFRIPVCLNEGDDYYLEVSRKDITHKIRWTKLQWELYFNNKNYFVNTINLSTIFDSPGVFCGIANRRVI